MRPSAVQVEFRRFDFTQRPRLSGAYVQSRRLEMTPSSFIRQTCSRNRGPSPTTWSLKIKPGGSSLNSDCRHAFALQRR